MAEKGRSLRLATLSRLLSETQTVRDPNTENKQTKRIKLNKNKMEMDGPGGGGDCRLLSSLHITQAHSYGPI